MRMGEKKLIVLDKEIFAKSRIDSYPLSCVYSDTAFKMKYFLKLPSENYPKIAYKVVAIELFKDDDKVYLYAPKIESFYFDLSEMRIREGLCNLYVDLSTVYLRPFFPENKTITLHYTSAFTQQELNEFFKQIGFSFELSELDKLENMPGELFLVYSSDYKGNEYVTLRYVPESSKEKDMKYVEFKREEPLQHDIENDQQPICQI